MKTVEIKLLPLRSANYDFSKLSQLKILSSLKNADKSNRLGIIIIMFYVLVCQDLFAFVVRSNSNQDFVKPT